MTHFLDNAQTSHPNLEIKDELNDNNVHGTYNSNIKIKF